jgi:uncharacterized lipoprotein YddW (UPF0748 family)
MRVLFYFTSISLLIVMSTPVLPGSGDPSYKHEFRAVWIATAIQLDWPGTTDPVLAEQRLRSMIRRSKDLGLNAVLFQVVARGDAVYPSERLPWSPWMTGTPGGDPGWDPLEIAIEETRRLGMELHAWSNVFIVGHTSHTPKSSGSSPPHVVYSHPEWIETVDNNEWLNPGIPEVREWIVTNVIELVENYDIDAVHFDYIRYPAKGFDSDQDLKSRHNPKGIADLDDWRRENVTDFVRSSYDAVKERKPWIKVGSAVAGSYQWYSGAPPSNWGYNDLYQESRKWLEEEIHDYVAPMIYHTIGTEPYPGNNHNSPDFAFIIREWTENAFGRQIYAGMAPYRDIVKIEIPDQIDSSRVVEADGHVYFRYEFIADTPPFAHRYTNRSIIPPMAWMGTESPASPDDVRFDRVNGTAVSNLQWDTPSPHEGADAVRYVIYRFDKPDVDPADLNDAGKIADITGVTYYDPEYSNMHGNYFVVTALDRNSNESGISNVVEIFSPDSPVLVHPSDGDMFQRDTVVLKWNFTDYASSYSIQISRDPDFAGDILLDMSQFKDTSYVVTGLDGQDTYYWRARATNAAGTGAFPEAYSFATAFPTTPLLVEPLHASVDVDINPVVRWSLDVSATSYRVQLSRSRTIIPETIVMDIPDVADTVFQFPDLEPGKIYYWRVAGINEYGMSHWSETWGFRTAEPVIVVEGGDIPERFVLHQNYPNPFNPTTTINFELPEAGIVSLRIYDMLGREVGIIINEHLTPGRYSFAFDAGDLSSGIYIYRLRAGEFVQSKRMILAQ